MIKDVLRARDVATHCPLCGREIAKAPHTEEHIFPLWLQQRHHLLNRRLTIPNIIGKAYKWRCHVVDGRTRRARGS
jgi:hypothetical protein